MKKQLLLSIVLLISIAYSTEAAERLAIKAGIANIRSGPGTQYEKVWQAERYYPIIVQKRQGAWILFKDFEGDLGWVHKSLVGKIDTVVTIKDNCNIRSGPGTNKEKIGTLDKGIPLKVLKREGKWLKIAHADGDEGWIYKTLVW
jgi:SH3-like domain-containing protein